MGYTLITPQPAARSEMLHDDQLGTGLYAGETALELDDGNLVAVSVEPKWLENGAGVAVSGCARWIDADGQTKTDAYGQHIESNTSVTYDAASVQKFGITALAKDMLLVLLGEPRENVVHEEGLDPSPITTLTSDALAAVNIRNHMAMVQDTGPTAVDPASLLGL